MCARACVCVWCRERASRLHISLLLPLLLSFDCVRAEMRCAVGFTQ